MRSLLPGFFVILAACGGGETKPPAEPAKPAEVHASRVGDRMPKPVVTPTKIPVPGAKLTLVSYFATWCHASGVWVPHVEDIRKKYESQGLAVIGVAHYGEEKLPDAIEFVHSHGGTYPVVFDAEHHITDAIPPLSWGQSIVVVDRDGVVQLAHIGTHPDAFAEVEAKIAALLAKAK